jgi:chromosome segregation ATPase
MYVIFPAAMLAAFLVFYSQERQHLEQVDQERQAAVAKQKADDDARQEMLQEKAREESEAHAAEQAKEAAQREADRLAKHRAEIAGFQAQVDKATADITAYNKKAKDLQDNLDALRDRKERDLREEFELTRQVEATRVQQETADLDNQRMIGMIADRADQSAMARAPAPAPAQ